MALLTHITLPTALLSMISVPLCSASLYDPPGPCGVGGKGEEVALGLANANSY